MFQLLIKPNMDWDVYVTMKKLEEGFNPQLSYVLVK
jgi:hypothetical protein